MRIHLALALTAAVGTAAFGLFAGAASAAMAPQQSTMKSCAANWKAMPAADQGKTKYKDYMSTCMKKTPAATTAAAPAPAPMMSAKPTKSAKAMKTAAPEAGSAKCKDGKTVTYAHRSGTCSGHGGVATWM